MLLKYNYLLNIGVFIRFLLPPFYKSFDLKKNTVACHILWFIATEFDWTSFTNNVQKHVF